MNEILGIDLGTSSVKALIVRDGEIIAKAKAGYDEISPEGWYAELFGPCAVILTTLPASTAM